MSTHTAHYVRTRTPTGTLARNTDAVAAALAEHEAQGYTLVSSVPDTDNGDLMGVLLLFVRER